MIRVLYVDADVLVRKDLKDLWDTDLCGKPIAAAPDVGFPMSGLDGSTPESPSPYFNAGVMLMDLALVRAGLDELYVTAAEKSDSTLKDQDALNAHLRGDWHPLSLKWNAQGLGTYAKYHTPDCTRPGCDG